MNETSFTVFVTSIRISFFDYGTVLDLISIACSLRIVAFRFGVTFDSLHCYGSRHM